VPDAVADLPVTPVTSYLIRHAEAGRRQDWEGPDELRPLTHHGHEQAGALVPLLAGVEIHHILSSPFVRCAQTVQPLADARGLAVEVTVDLAEGAGAGPALEILGRAGESLALCSHGDVIDEVLHVLARQGAVLEGRVRDLETPKGATWVLTVTGGRVSSGRLLPPP
jgi:phosphohistidine phosphatase SixA